MSTIKRVLAAVSCVCCAGGCLEAVEKPETDVEEARKAIVGKWEGELGKSNAFGKEYTEDGEITVIQMRWKDDKPTRSVGKYSLPDANTLVSEFEGADGVHRSTVKINVRKSSLTITPIDGPVITYRRVKEFSTRVLPPERPRKGTPSQTR